MLLQGTAPGILGGIVKGFKAGKMVHTMESSTDPKSSFSQLEEKFLKPPFSESFPTVPDNEEVELNIGSATSITIIFLFVDSSLTSCLCFGTDDIEIDEEPPMAASSSHEVTNMKRGKPDFPVFVFMYVWIFKDQQRSFCSAEKGNERERLLGAPDDTKPRLRTREEIIAKYRKTEVTSDDGFSLSNLLYLKNRSSNKSCHLMW